MVEHGGMQVDVMLERELRALHPGLQAAGRESDTGPGLSIWNLKAHPQWHTSSNKATPPNSATHSLWVYGAGRAYFYSNHHIPFPDPIVL